MKSKPLQIGYTKIMRLQQKWEKEIRTAKQMLIIGAKPYPVDNHIWQPLSETNGKVAFIGSKSEFNNWINQIQNAANYKYLSDNWESALEEGIEFLVE
jgi:hypothetical protein